MNKRFDAHKDAVRRLTREGKSVCEIARTLGFSDVTITIWQRRLGIQRQQLGLIPISSTALKILALIQHNRDTGKAPPNYYEMMDVTGVTPNAVTEHLRRLRRLGILSSPGKLQRALTLNYRLEVIP